MPDLNCSIAIQADRCTRCGACIDVCPGDILTMGPHSAEISRPQGCISCGHCALICPADAIDSAKSNQRAPFTMKDIPSSLPAEHALLLSKRSIRTYREDKLDKKIIENVIQYAEQAPSSHNFRQREYMVIMDPVIIEDMEKIVVKVYRSLLRVLSPAIIRTVRFFSTPMAWRMEEFFVDFKNMVKQFDEGKAHIFRNAPCVIFVLGPKNYDQARDDCVAAQQYMMLYAHSLGIGSCVIGYAQYAHKRLEKYFNVSRGMKIYAVTVLGYPVYRYEKAIKYKDRPITWRFMEADPD